MKIAITDIKIDNRYRHDVGDMQALADSINALGLLHPVVVTPDHRLVAGGRRIEAVKLLGWTEIEATVAESLDDARKLLLAERDENTCRKDSQPLGGGRDRAPPGMSLGNARHGARVT